MQIQKKKKGIEPTKSIYTVFYAIFIALISNPVSAQGLTKMTTVLQSFEGQLLIIIPILAVIALMILGILYAMKFIQKETFANWAIGLIVAGSAAELTALFFT